MPGERQRQLLRYHAAPVIGNADKGLAAICIGYFDSLRPGVESILDKFLDRRGRPFNNFARRNAVDGSVIKLADHRAIRAHLGLGFRHATRPSIIHGDSTTENERSGPGYSAAFTPSGCPTTTK
jgi:hypothetical protein